MKTANTIPHILRRIQPLLNNITQATSLKVLAEAIHDVAAQYLEFSSTGFYFFNPTNKKLELIYAMGFTDEEKREAEATAMDRHPGWVIKNKKYYLKNNESPQTEFQIRMQIHSRLYYPILFKGECIGTLGFVSQNTNAYNDDHVAFVEFLCQIVAVTYENILHTVQLESSRDRLDHAIKALKFGIWDWDVENDVLVWDDYMYTLYDISKENFSGAYEAFIKTLHPSDKDRVTSEISRCIKVKSVFISEFRILTQNQSEKMIAANGRVILNERGGVARIVGANWDITQIRTNEIKIMNASKMSSLGEMAAGIAHEINNPLTIIQGKAYQLAKAVNESQIDSERLAKLASDIERTTQRIAKIIQGLRAFSREGAQDRFEIRDANSILDETLALCSERFKNNNIDLKVEPCPIATSIACRPTQISQILLNFLNNSFDAIEGLASRWVKIKVEDFGGEVEFSVTDSGPGIPASIRNKILQPFFTTKDVGKGTGLGLSVSLGIATSHHGRLFLDETAPNTRFVLRLPKRQS